MAAWFYLENAIYKRYIFEGYKATAIFNSRVEKDYICDTKII